MASLTVRSDSEIEKIFNEIIELINNSPSFCFAKNGNELLELLISIIRDNLEWIESKVELDH